MSKGQGALFEGCQHPDESYRRITISQNPELVENAMTWDVDVCSECGAERNERNRRPTGGDD